MAKKVRVDIKATGASKASKDLGKVEVNPKFEGRQMIMIIQPN